MNGAPGSKSEFFDSFYDSLMAASPEAALKFKNTEMAEQIRMLRASVAILVAFSGSEDHAEYMEKLASRHSSSGVDVSPALYGVWLECLVETVRRFDWKFDPEVEIAWRAVFAKGIEFMTARYDGKNSSH